MNSLTLPFPISENRAWRSIAGAKKGLIEAALAYDEGKGSWRDVLKRLYVNVTLSKEYRAWKKLCELPLAAQKTNVLTGPVTVSATFYFPNLRGDLTNRPKVLLDLLQAVCYRNDSQIHEAHWIRATSKDNPRVEVTVRPFAPEMFTSEEIDRTLEMKF